MELMVKIVLVMFGLFSGTTLVYIVASLECGVLVTIIVLLLYLRGKRRHRNADMSLLANGASLCNPESSSGNMYTEIGPSKAPLQQTDSNSSHLYSSIAPRATGTNDDIQTNANRESSLPTNATGYIDMTSNNVTTSVDAITQHLYSDVPRETPAVTNSRLQNPVYENIEEDYINEAFEDVD
ncbi:uncharacterized protein [Haliotis cracherodii]|uniref:uncharacterized protein n=1 Tax=Haliotis cracherodii TaxID=6455 RepID=UPI0039EC4A00